MARPKTQINRKTDILDAAQVLFSEKGFEKTTMEEIAKHIGISKGSLYLEFKNKDDIYIAIVKRLANSILNQLEEIAVNSKPPYLDIIKQILVQDVLTVFDMSTSHIQTHIALMHTSYRIKKELQPVMQRGLNAFAGMLEKAAKNGEIIPVNDCLHTAFLIDASLHDFFPPYNLKYSQEYRTDLTKEEIRKLLQNDATSLVEIILSGLKAS